MKKRLSTRHIVIHAAAAVGILLTAIQTAMHLFGHELCFNSGCKIVENFLNLNPVVINGLGLLFFIAVFSATAAERKGRLPEYVIEAIILCAMVAEGILLSIQIFMADTFCSYCLVIAAIIVSIAVLYKARTALVGLSFIAIQVAIFSFMDLSCSMEGSVNLNQGTYAVKTCSNPRNVAYLIFSQDCPHCKKVLASLNGCVRCEIHFNPVSKINKEILPGLVPIEGYRPEVNVLALHVFDIDAVPVLIHRTDDGYKIIKGDKKILQFIEDQCFCPGSGAGDLPFVDQSPIFDTQEGVCSFQEECK